MEGHLPGEEWLLSGEEGLLSGEERLLWLQERRFSGPAEGKMAVPG